MLALKPSFNLLYVQKKGFIHLFSIIHQCLASSGVQSDGHFCLDIVRYPWFSCRMGGNPILTALRALYNSMNLAIPANYRANSIKFTSGVSTE